LFDDKKLGGYNLLIIKEVPGEKIDSSHRHLIVNLSTSSRKAKNQKTKKEGTGDTSSKSLS
jgi:hypothetical protein